MKRNRWTTVVLVLAGLAFGLFEEFIRGCRFGRRPFDVLVQSKTVTKETSGCDSWCW